jgi:hypothetical protein
MVRPLLIEYEGTFYHVGNGQRIGDLSYAGVVKAYQRFSISLRKNKLLRKEVEAIRANLS